MRVKREFLAEHPNEHFTLGEMYRRLTHEERNMFAPDFREAMRLEAESS
jgi:hypothetical protein